MGRIPWFLLESFFKIAVGIALVLLTPVASASIADPVPAGICHLYMLDEIPFDTIMPEVGPSLVELFPTSILNSNETVVLMLKEKAESSVRVQNDRQPGKSARSYGVIRYSERLREQNWRWRKMQVGVRNLRAISSQFPEDQFLTVTSPLTVLPREWQLRLIKKLERSSDFEKSSLENLLQRAKNSQFSISVQEPRQVEPSASRVGNLDPEPRLKHILGEMMRHYFGTETSLDERLLQDIYRRHIFFRLAP